MTDEIFFDGVRYISASEAAELAGFSRDYVARLCKDGKLLAKRIGKQWYVCRDTLQQFVVEQKYAKAKWRDGLARTRREEYKDRTKTSAFLGRPSVSRIPERVAESLAPRIPSFVHSALGTALRAPGGMHAARAVSGFPLQVVSAGKQVSAHALPPVADALHKLLAIVTALLFTVGTYLFVDAQYARLTSQTGVAERASLLASAFVDSAEKQLALAAENPADAFSNMFEQFARSINRRVDTLVYGIMFPQELIGFSSDRELVSVRVVPQSSPAKSASIAESETPEKRSAGSMRPAQTIINQPVIERVVERVTLQPATAEVLAKAGGITEEILAARLNQLDNKLTSQIYAVASVGSANSTQIVNNYNAVGGALRIDELDKITLEDSTITGGSITGTSVSATSLTVTGTGTSTFSGGIQATALNITSTGSTTFAGGLILSDGCIEVNGTCLTGGGTAVGGDTQVQFSNNGSLAGSSAFTFSSSTSLLKFTSASSSLLSLFDRLYVGGTATTTIRGDGFASTLPFASSTALTVSGMGYFGTASTTNFTVSGIQNGLLSTNATGAVVATTTPTASYFIATAADASRFPFASSTALTVSGTGYFGSASTTNLTISGIQSSLLQTGATGVVSAAVSGTDYATPSQIASAFPFTTDLYNDVVVNATSTALWLKATSPFSLIASSTFVTQASTTLFTNTGNTYLTSLSSAVLGVDTRRER